MIFAPFLQATGRLNILMDENSGVSEEFNMLSQGLTPLLFVTPLLSLYFLHFSHE